MDLKAIEDAIYAEFLGDAALLAALGGAERRMYSDEAPQNPTSPYCVYTFITGVPDPTWTSDGEIEQFQFTVFNKDIDSPLDKTTINDVVKKLCAAYDDAVLTITGHTSIGVTRGVAGTVPKQDDTQQFVVTYEIMIEDD